MLVNKQVLYAWALLLIMANTHSVAAGPQIPQSRPGDEKLPLESAPSAAAVMAVPLAPEKPVIHKAQPRFVLKRIRLHGNNRISTRHLLEQVQSFVGRQVSSADLRVMRLALTRYYIQQGYINSGALLPDQSIKNGVVHYQIVEGKLSDVSVKGNDKYHKRYFKKRIAYGLSEVLNIRGLENNLKRLQVQPGIGGLHARLLPADRLGQSRLLVELEETPQKGFQWAVDNSNASSVGESRTGLSFVHDNLFGGGQQINLDAQLNENMHDYQIGVLWPITASGMSLYLAYRESQSQIIEWPFEPIHIGSISRDQTAGLRIPVSRYVRRPQWLSMEVSKRRSRTTLAGEPFTISDGFQQGEAHVSVGRLIYEWRYYAGRQTIALRGKLSMGFDAWDATENVQRPDGKFTSFIGQFIYFLRPAVRHQVLFQISTQTSNEPLLSLEQFSLGGANSVRGYPENLTTADKASVSSLEWRYKVLTGTRLWLLLFGDYGHAWNEERKVGDVNELAGVGAGLIWQFGKVSELKLEFGEALIDIPRKRGDLQEHGLHVAFKSGFRF